jgi:DNA-binding transcriptional regulator YiaG
MTQKEIEVAAKADHDNRSLSGVDLARMKRTPQVNIIRRALGISQEDFAIRYHIPVDTLRDWEQGSRCARSGRAGVPDRHRARPGSRKQGARCEAEAAFLRRLLRARTDVSACEQAGVRLRRNSSVRG